MGLEINILRLTSMTGGVQPSKTVICPRITKDIYIKEYSKVMNYKNTDGNSLANYVSEPENIFQLL